jgi:hypothetical protein
MNEINPAWLNTINDPRMQELIQIGKESIQNRF